MKKFLVQTMIGDEMFTEVMTREELLRVVETNVHADYIDDMKIFDVTEFGVAKNVSINDVLSAGRAVFVMIVGE